MKKRGQAAMEFLMTYGWAILAAVIVIAVLASFGVFSGDKYVPTTCVISAPWGCDKNQVAADSTGNNVTFVLVNGGGQMYDNVNISLSGDCDGVYNVGHDIDDGVVSPNVVVPCTGGIGAGEKIQSDITVTYSANGGTITMTSSGSLTVEAT